MERHSKSVTLRLRKPGHELSSTVVITDKSDEVDQQIKKYERSFNMINDVLNMKEDKKRGVWKFICTTY